MNTTLYEDLEGLDTILEETKQVGLSYLKAIDNIPTTPPSQEIKLSDVPEEGVGSLESLKLFKQAYQPFMVSAAGPRYWGFVTGGTTPASIAGDWLCSVFDQNTQVLLSHGDVSVNFEKETVRLMRQLLSLPDSFLGGFVSGATMSNFTCLAVARQWAGLQMNVDIARDGMRSGIVVLSATPHSSVIKSLAMLGFGSAQMVRVKTNPGTESMDIAHLKQLLDEYKKQSVIVSSSAGTVNTASFDDLNAISHLKAEYHFWHHIDAAFGGFVACSPQYAYLLEGWEKADSITIDCHKWMNVPYDSALYFVKECYQHLQIQTFQNSNAPYLGINHQTVSFNNLGPENSRRFRALPAWFGLMAYGRQGFKEIIENSVHLAQTFGNFINQSEYFRLLAPVGLNSVCFTLAEQADHVEIFLNRLNSTGKVFMSPSVYNSQKCIRVTLVNWRTTEQDVQMVVEELLNVYYNLFPLSTRQMAEIKPKIV